MANPTKGLSSAVNIVVPGTILPFSSLTFAYSGLSG